MKAALEVAKDPEAVRRAEERLTAATAPAASEKAAETRLRRYQRIASVFPEELYTAASVRKYLAVSVEAGYASLQESLSDILALSNVSAEERAELQRLVSTLKRRGVVAAKEGKTPVLLRDINAAWGALAEPERVAVSFAFFGGLRKSEVENLSATPGDRAIRVVADGRRRLLDFSKCPGKNLFCGTVMIKCVCQPLGKLGWQRGICPCKQNLGLVKKGHLSLGAAMRKIASAGGFSGTPHGIRTGAACELRFAGEEPAKVTMHFRWAGPNMFGYYTRGLSSRSGYAGFSWL
jgi:hypothetical protein